MTCDKMDPPPPSSPVTSSSMSTDTATVKSISTSTATVKSISTSTATVKFISTSTATVKSISTTTATVKFISTSTATVKSMPSSAAMVKSMSTSTAKSMSTATAAAIEVESGGWRSCMSWSPYHTPELEKLLLAVVSKFYSPTELTILKAILYHSSMTEDELQRTLQLDDQTLRTSVQLLVHDKILKVRQAGDANESRVDMGHIHVNFSSLRNNFAYKLSMIREKVEIAEKKTTQERRWHRMRSYLTCTNVNCSKIYVEMLYAMDFYHAKLKEFRCTFCTSKMEEVSEMHPSFITLCRFNESFGYLYKLLQDVDASSPQIAEIGGGTAVTVGKRNHHGMNVRVKIIDAPEVEAVPIPKEIPPWFHKNDIQPFCFS